MNSIQKDSKQTPELIGPFTISHRTDGFDEIVGANGEVAVWVEGEGNAQIVCRLLNAGHRLGVLNRTQRQQASVKKPNLNDQEGFVIYGL